MPQQASPCYALSRYELIEGVPEFEQKACVVSKD